MSACLLASLLCGGTLAAQEAGVDRPGSDLKPGFELTVADPGLCRKACDQDPQCKAYTYVRPGVQGAKARCWLKGEVPPTVPNPDCVSGVRSAVAPLQGQQPSAVKAAPASFVGSSIHAGTLTYAAADHTTTVTTVASTVGDRPAWLFVEARQGGLLDTLYVDRSTLVPLRRVLRFIPSPYYLEETFGPDSVVGRVFGENGLEPHSFAAARPVYVGAAIWAGIATLPLAPGYRVGFRTVDEMEGVLFDIEVTVAGIEHVRVPAGEFDAFRVEARALGTPTVHVAWIERAAPHRVVRRGSEELKSM